MDNDPRPHPAGRRRHLRAVSTQDARGGPEPTGGDVSVYEQDDVVVVLLRGSIDIRQAQELEEAGGFAIERQIPIMVDVRHVEMIDSVGISFLVRVAASIRSHGRTVTLCGPAPLVEEMLSVAGAATLFAWIDGRPGPGGDPTP